MGDEEFEDWPEILAFFKEVYVQMAHNFLFMKVDVVCVESPIPIANQNLIFLLNFQQTCVYLRCV